MIKHELLQRVIDKLKENSESAKQNLATAKQAVIDAPGAMQSHSDTTRWQMSRRVEAIENTISETLRALNALELLMRAPPTVTKCSSYAVIEAQNLDDGTRAKYFLLPAGGGSKYEVDGEEITVLTVGAPMARAFMGASAGDEVELKIQGTTRRFSVIAVA